MSDQGGPKRTETSPTLVIPRDQLAPVSSPKIHVEIVDDEREVERDAATLVECPACEGQGMVTVEKRGELAERLSRIDEDDDEEPTP